MKVCKKPVVVDAWKWTPDGILIPTTPNWILEAFTMIPDNAPLCIGALRRVNDGDDSPLWIGTLEGVMQAEPGDWIIRGIKGELYSCKPEIFEATYETIGN